MHWVEWLAGVENAHYLLADYPDEVEALFDAQHRRLVRRTRIVAESSPLDATYFVENTSTSLISPTQYRRYCLPHITEYATIVRDAGMSMILHMCGMLKDILPDLATLPVAGFEAFTSSPLGNTTFGDGRTHCPETCLIGGTNAVLWLRPAEEIVETLQADLDALPHHRGIVPTSAGVMPPLCPPARIKAVGDRIKRYDARME